MTRSPSFDNLSRRRATRRTNSPLSSPTAAPLIVVEIYQRASGRLEVLTAGPFLVRYTAALALLLTLIAFSAPGGQEFIYFDF